jgi:iron complex outermembrane receptor protein
MQHECFSRSAAGFGCAIAVQAALAGPDAGLPTEQEYLADVPTVLSASRLLQPVSEAPVSMTILDRATIEASGLRSVADVLRLVPGMFVRPGNGLNGVVEVVSYHGLTNEYARRMQVLIDGRSVYLPPFSTVLWDDLPLAIDDIDHIEVTRGPNAASDGANAFFGTVNIVTRTPIAGEGVFALARAGSDGVRDYVVRDVGAVDRINYRLTLGHRADDGFVELFDSQHHDYLTGRADLDLDPADSLQAQIGYSTGERDLGIVGAPVNVARRKEVEDAYLQAKWVRAQNPGEELSTQYYFERHSATEAETTARLRLPGQPARSYPLQADYRFDRHDLEVVRTTTAAPDLRMVFGAGARLDEVKTPIYFGERPYLSSNLERLFVHAEWRATTSLLLQAGAMLERTSIDGTGLSPRLSAAYRIDAHQTARAGVSRAERTPSLFEAQGDFELSLGSLRLPIDRSGGNVRSERMVSTELGYHLSEVRGTIQLDIKVYRDRAGNLVGEYADPSAPYFIVPTIYWKNLGDARVTGAELEFHYQPAPRTRCLLSYANTLVSTSEPIFQRTMPRNVLAVLAQRPFGSRWVAAAAVYMTSRLPPKSGIFGQNADEGVGFQRRLDLHLERAFNARGTGIRMTFGVENLHSDFVEFHPTTTFRRRWYLQLATGG